MNKDRKWMKFFCDEMKMKEIECKSIHVVIKKRKKIKEKNFIISKAIEWKAFIKDLIGKQSLWNKERKKNNYNVFIKQIMNDKVFIVK